MNGSAADTTPSDLVASALVEAAKPLGRTALVLDDDDGSLARHLAAEGTRVVSVVQDPERAADLSAELTDLDVDVRCGDPLGSWGMLRQGDLFEDFESASELFRGAPFAIVALDARPGAIDRSSRPRLRSEFVSARNQFGRDVLLIERATQLAGPDGRVVFACREDLFSREVGGALSERVLSDRGPHLVVDARQASPPRVVIAERPDDEQNRSIRPRPGVPAENRWAVVLAGLADPKHPWVDWREIAAGLNDPADALDSSSARGVIAQVASGSEGVAAELVASAPGRTTACGFRDIWLAEAGSHARPLVGGDDIGDWRFQAHQHVLWPYERPGRPVARIDDVLAVRLGEHRPLLESRRVFGEPLSRRGLSWWEHAEHYPSRIEAPFRVIVATRGTHNRAALTTDTQYLAASSAIVAPARDLDSALLLLGLLNSSLICFWFKHTAARRRRFEITVSQLLDLPLPARNRDAIIAIARKLDRLARQFVAYDEIAARHNGATEHDGASLAGRLSAETVHRERLRGEMVWWQEELDWAVYAGYGLVRRTDTDTLPAALAPHERPFLTARSHPGRASLIEHDPALGAVERANYKRPFVDDDPADAIADALDRAMRQRLENLLEPGEAAAVDAFRARALKDDVFGELCEAAGHDAEAWLDAFVESLLPTNPLRIYTDTGWAKRIATLDSALAAMRREAGDHGASANPAIFARTDFVNREIWSARGRHDVQSWGLRSIADLEPLEGRVWLIRSANTPSEFARYVETMKDLYLRRAFHVPELVDDAAFSAVSVVFAELERRAKLLGHLVELSFAAWPFETEQGAVETFRNGAKWGASGYPTPQETPVAQLDLDRLARMKSLFDERREWSQRDVASHLYEEGWAASDARRTLLALEQAGDVTRRGDLFVRVRTDG